MSKKLLSERLAAAQCRGIGDPALFNLIDEAKTMARHVEQSTRVWVYYYGDILRTTPPPPGMEDFVQAHCALVPVDLTDTELADILAKRQAAEAAA